MSTSFTAFPSMQWLWCLLAFSTGPGYLIAAVTVPQTQPQPQPKGPATVEAQAKYFQDFFSVQLSPYKLEFGHVCEDPNTWEQRYEHKDLKNFRDMGKVRWGDKHGGYGEHYWDLNHAGSTNNHATADDTNDHTHHDHDYDYKHDGDDGSYDATGEKGHYNPNYGEGDDYDSENLAKTDFSAEINRSKRAHPKIKAEKRIYRAEEDDGSYEKYAKNNNESDEEVDKEEEEVLKQEVQKTIPKRKSKRQHKPAIKELNLEEDPEDEQEQITLKPKIRKIPKNNEKLNNEETNQNQEEEKGQPNHTSDTDRRVNENPLRQGRTVFNPYRADVQRINEHYGARNLQDHYVPYERQHQAQGHQDASPAASTPFRLFLEPSTGHVIDRATGLAYFLQPVAPVTNFDSYNAANYN